MINPLSGWGSQGPEKVENRVPGHPAGKGTFSVQEPHSDPEPGCSPSIRILPPRRSQGQTGRVAVRPLGSQMPIRPQSWARHPSAWMFLVLGFSLVITAHYFLNEICICEHLHIYVRAVKIMPGGDMYSALPWGPTEYLLLPGHLKPGAPGGLMPPLLLQVKSPGKWPSASHDYKQLLPGSGDWVGATASQQWSDSNKTITSSHWGPLTFSIPWSLLPAAPGGPLCPERTPHVGCGLWWPIMDTDTLVLTEPTLSSDFLSFV